MQAAQLAYHLEAHAIAIQLVNLADQIKAQKPHQIVDLGRRPLPVLRGESVERQIFDTQFGCPPDTAAHGLRSSLVAGDPRQAACLGPAAVAIHDDGNMNRRFDDAGGGERFHGLRPARFPFPSRQGLRRPS